AFLSYGLGLAHKHLPETMRYGGLTRTPIFTPNVGGWAQGMTVTIPLHLHELGVNAEGLHATLKAHYAGQKYVKVFEMAENPEILDPQTLNGTNNLELFVYPAADGERALLAARLDNLGKGASGAAVQNLELMLALS
ncbi:MAG: N-acetyl-gamma-glutamyl-phosphate reductase, partial [Deinococcus sp.]|nr:N-acetyl-gamma-glutamyl-phosphate reductase [Deinococcus sp.]